MATGKRYYWIKLKDSFLTSDTVDYFMSQPDGANYVVLYQMLLLKTINTDGKLARQIGEVIIPYDAEKIRRDCKWFSADTIRVAMNLYKAFGLIYEDANGVLTLADHGQMVGSETDYAIQKRAQREALPPATVDIVHTDVHENVHTENRDKRIDIRDIENREKREEKEIVSSSKERSGNFPDARARDPFSAYAMNENDQDLTDALLTWLSEMSASGSPLSPKEQGEILTKLRTEFPRGEWIPAIQRSTEKKWRSVYARKEDKKAVAKAAQKSKWSEPVPASDTERLIRLTKEMEERADE